MANKKYNQFRVLFVYPNIQMRTVMPPGISLMAALLQEHDFTCEVFDATRYPQDAINLGDDEDTSHEQFVRMEIHKNREKNLSVLPFDWGERQITLKQTNMWEDFKKKVAEYSPDLIAISVVENTYELAMRFTRYIPSKTPVVCGGVFCTFAPEAVIHRDNVDFLVLGEGEYALLDLCKALADGKPTDKIANTWAKQDGRISKNKLRPPADVNQLPIPDFSLFDESLSYTPMQGKVRKALAFETQRGCPFTCTYCNSPSNNMIYENHTGHSFYRKKSIARLRNEMEILVKKYRPELVYFVADTFFAMTRKEIDEFSEFYQDYRIPFWMNTRAETINEHTAEHLAKMNCLRFNIGIEHGNETFRKDVLKRKVSNKGIVRAFEIAAGYADQYTCVANSIIGLPTETPELAFDSIQLNCQLPDEIVSAGAFIFAPYHGAPLRGLAVEKKYISPDLICTDSSNTAGGSLLKMPGFTAEQIQGFFRTFSLYVKLPRSKWPLIDKARQFTDEGNKIFRQLSEEYSRTYLSPSVVKDKDGIRVAAMGEG